jgi:hypothetical protein
VTGAVSTEAAAAVYGVELAGTAVDVAGTERRRTAARRWRLGREAAE